MKKIISLVLISMLLLGFCAFAQSPSYEDIQNHWAQNQIEKWSGYGVITGYEGRFFPDDNITRGEFATIINRVFKFETPAENTFSDLGEEYYTKNILCLNNRGIMTGFDGKIRPEDNITREEAGAMIYKLLRMTENEEVSQEFYDEKDISDWAKVYMNSLVNEGYFTGDSGYLRPKDSITRAEAVTLLDNCTLILTETIEGEKNDKICIVSCDGVVIKNCEFEKDLFVTDNVSDLSIEDSKVEGTMYVYAESEKAVVLKNCTINETEAKYPKAVWLKSENTVDTPDEEQTDSPSEEVTEYVEEGTGVIVDVEDLPEESGSDGESGQPSEDYETGGESGQPSGDEEDDIPEEEKPTIETTLEDGLFQKNSKKVFDVVARDKYGDKTECRVSCNGTNIEPSWDDEIKTSFTLEFFESGEYVVEILATDSEGISQKKTCTITYEMAEYGEVTGKAIMSIEAFTVGGGYIVAPVEIDVLEGVSCAHILDVFLTENNLSYLSTGSLDGGFYLATVSDIPEFTPQISETLLSALSDAGFDADEESYTPGELSEFDFTHGSGWMYCVNNVFPNVGFSEYYLQDGDVVRIQFTLAYGSDIGGVSGAGYSYAGDFYEMVNRDELTKLIAQMGIESVESHMELITKPDLTEDELSSLMSQLQ